MAAITSAASASPRIVGGCRRTDHARHEVAPARAPWGRRLDTLWGERADRSAGDKHRKPACSIRVLPALVLLLVLLDLPASATDGDEAPSPSLGAKVFDVVVLRTPYAAWTAVGSVLFLVAGPLSAPAGAFDEATDLLVLTPYRHLTGPLGEF